MPAYHLRVTQEFDLASVRAFVQGSIAEMRAIQREASTARSARDPQALAAIQTRTTQVQTGIEEGLGRLQGQRTAGNASIIDPTTRTLRGDLERLQRVYGVELLRGEELAAATGRLARERDRSAEFERRHQARMADPVASGDADRERRDLARRLVGPDDAARERADRVRRQEADTKFADEVRERRARVLQTETRSAEEVARAATGTRDTRAADRVAATTKAAKAEDPYLARRGLETIEGESPGARKARAEAQDKLDKQRYRASAEGLAIEAEANRLRDAANDQLRGERRARRALNEGIEDEARDKALDVVERAKLKGATADVLSDQPTSINTLAESQLSTAALAQKVRRESEELVAQRRAAKDPLEMARLDDRLEGLKQQQVRLAQEDVEVKRGHLRDDDAIAAFRDQANVRDEFKSATRSDVQIAKDNQKLQDSVRGAAEKENLARERQVRQLHSFTTATKAQQEAIISRAYAAALKEDQARGYHARVIHEMATHEARMAAPASAIQRAQTALQRRPGIPDKPPSEQPTGRQLLGQGVLSAARFGAGAGLLYGTISTVRELITTSSELERIFNQIERQFIATDSAGEFPGFKKSMLDISKLTGESAKDVAFVGFQMKGAYTDTTTAVEATTDAIKVARVTALPLNEIVDSLTGASKAFGVSIAEVGDRALGLQERFGVLAKESIKVFADLGPAAAAAGLEIEQVGAIIAGIQQISGRSGGVIAESLGRVLPTIGSHAAEILAVYQSNRELQGRAPDISSMLGKGETGKVFMEILRDYDKFTDAQRQKLGDALGGERNAQTLDAAFQNRKKILEEEKKRLDDLGKTESYFADLQETLAQKLDRAKQQFIAFGLAIFESGIGDALKDIVTVGGELLGVLSQIMGLFASFNRATGGVAVKLLEVYAAIKLISLISRGLGGGLGGRVGGALGGVGGFFGGVGGMGFGQGVLGTRYVLHRDDALAASGLGLRSDSWRNVGLASTRPGAWFQGTRAGSVATGALGAVGGLPTMAIGAALVVNQVRERTLRENEKQADEFRRKLKAADTQTIENILKGKEGFWDKVRRLIGMDTAKSLRDAELGARELAEPFNPNDPNLGTNEQVIKAAQALGFFHDPGKKPPSASGAPGIPSSLDRPGPKDGTSATDLVKEGLNKDKVAIDELTKQINEAIGGDPANLQKLRDQLAKDKAKYAKDETKAKIDDGTVLETVKNAKALWEAGETTATEYANTILEQTRLIQQVLSGNPHDEKNKKAAADIAKEQAAFQSAMARKVVDYNLQNAELAGGGGAEAQVSAYTNLLTNPQFTDRSEREKATADLMAALKAQLQEEADMAESAAERAAILRRGIKVPDVARTEILKQQVNALDVDFRAFLNTVGGSVEKGAELLSVAAARAVKDSISIAEALKRIMAERAAEVRKQLVILFLSNPFAAGNKQWTDLMAELDRIENAAKTGVPNSLVTTPTGTVKGSGKDIKTADDTAAKEAKAEAEAVAKANMALKRALNEGDPVALADAAIEEAKLMMQLATKDSERINAQAQLVLAQHAKIAAQGQVADAYANIDKALHLAADDTIAVAQDEINAANRHLANARERGDRMGILASEAELIAANRGKVDAEVALRQERIDTGLALETMSTAQAIAAYEGMMQIPGVTKKMVDQFLIKIHQLRKEASSNLAFDIPTDIKLPTLYEVRRANQTENAGVGYQDNRAITINFTANNTADAQSIANQIVDQFSGPPRVGALPRGY